MLPFGFLAEYITWSSTPLGTSVLACMFQYTEINGYTMVLFLSSQTPTKVYIRFSRLLRKFLKLAQ